MNIPSDEIMKAMAKAAMEQATTFFAAQAREFAKNTPAGTPASVALEAFASAIESTNAKTWPKGKPQ